MSELWYWKSNDRTRGPLVTEELEAIVLSKRLQDGDAVRLDGTDEWLPADEIRQMFAGSAESPAQTAARLLESAAARRLKGGSSSPRRSIPIGPLFSGVLDRCGSALTHIVEFAARAAGAIASWLGLRGRIIVTVVAAVVAVGFLCWQFVPWGESDLVRLQRLKGIWKQMQVQPDSSTAVAPEVSEWLEKTETDLSVKVREHPISATKGGDRQKALARREMLFAVREIRQPDLNDDSRERVNESLELATNYLLEMPGAAKTASSSKPAAGTGQSTIVTAILVIDSVLLLGFATWWFLGRSKR